MSAADGRLPIHMTAGPGGLAGYRLSPLGDGPSRSKIAALYQEAGTWVLAWSGAPARIDAPAQVHSRTPGPGGVATTGR